MILFISIQKWSVEFIMTASKIQIFVKTHTHTHTDFDIRSYIFTHFDLPIQDIPLIEKTSFKKSWFTFIHRFQNQIRTFTFKKYMRIKIKFAEIYKMLKYDHFFSETRCCVIGHSR